MLPINDSSFRQEPQFQPLCLMQVQGFVSEGVQTELLSITRSQNKLASSQGCCVLITLFCCCYSLSCVRLFCDPMDCSPPESFVHGIFQARILEWVVISFSRGSSWPRDQICIFCITGRFFTSEPPGKPILTSLVFCLLYISGLEDFFYFSISSTVYWKEYLFYHSQDF